MKTRFIQCVLSTLMLLLTLTTTGALPGGAKPAYAEPSPQVSASSEGQPNPPVNPKGGDTQPPPVHWGVYGIVAGLMVLLGVLFVLLIWWSSRLEQASYLGSLFRDTVEEVDYRRRAQPYTEKWGNQEYHEEARQDPKIQQAIAERQEKEIAERHKRGREKNKDSKGENGPGAHSTETGLWEIGPGYRPITGWSTGRGYEREVEAQAYQKYRDDLDRVRQDAKKSADQAASVDLNVLRGRGAEFVLEFTAVVFLVFAVTLLGLMNILKSEPIATLLAAIAGYVLGRASTRKQGREGTEEHVTVSTAEMTELVRAVAGIAKPAGQASQNEPATSKVPSGAPAESGK